MEFKKKPGTSPTQSVKTVQPLQRKTASAPKVPVSPDLQRQKALQKALQPHLTRPVKLQRQMAKPALQAAELQTKEIQRLATQKAALQRQADQLGAMPPEVISQALQRQQAPAPQMPTKPQSVGDWVTVMRMQAEQAQSRRMGEREAMQYTALQRQVANTIAQNFRQDRQPAIQRYEQYGQHLASLQRSAAAAPVANVALQLMPAGERLAVQRAMDDSIQREAAQQAQDEQALKLHSLQRQMAELNHEAMQPVMARIQARRGSGNPLPEAVQRHLEQGLNHDLSAVRIHDDAEADKLAKKVNAVAFTTGQDIYFRAGKFNPNSQSGLELLAHEVTHTVQQAKGEVGSGLDPDSGLEQEARRVGKRLSQEGMNSRRGGTLDENLPARSSQGPRSSFSPRIAQRTTLQREPSSTAGGGTPAPRGNMNRRHLLSNLDFYKGTHSGNSYLLANLAETDIQKLYSEAIKKGVKDGAVVLSNGQTWYVRWSDGKFHPMSGPGIINLTQQEVAFFRVLKANKGNPVQAFENIVMAMRGQKYGMTAHMRIAIEAVGKQLGVPAADLARIFQWPLPKTSPATTAWPAVPSPAKQAPNRIGAAQAVEAGGTIQNPPPELVQAAKTKAAGRAFKLVRWGGRILLLVAVAADTYEIYQSNFAPKVIVRKAGGWVGATAAGGAASSALSPMLAGGPWGWLGYGALVGGAGALGYFAGEKITETVYEWSFEK